MTVLRGDVLTGEGAEVGVDGLAGLVVGVGPQVAVGVEGLGGAGVPEPGPGPAPS